MTTHAMPMPAWPFWARRFDLRAVTVALVLAGALVTAGLGAAHYVDQERTRSLNAWRGSLAVVAESRAQAVSLWLDQQRHPLAALADNTALQLYMTDLTHTGSASYKSDLEKAQIVYLRNLLMVAADQSGFTAPDALAPVAANVSHYASAGIGLLDAEGDLVVGTPGLPPPTEPVRSAVTQAMTGTTTLIGLHLSERGVPTLGFATPIHDVQADDASAPIGVVIGLRPATPELFQRLLQPGDTSTSAETILVRAENGAVRYLSPLADGTPALARQLPRADRDLAAAIAVAHPGRFAEALNYAGRTVLFTSRAIPGTPWVLVRSIDRKEALATTDARLDRLLLVVILSLASIALAMALIWRHASALRSARDAETQRIAAERFANMTKFMRVVTNSQPTEIVAVDSAGRYTFANRRAGEDAGLAAEDMVGKTMANVLGPLRARTFSEINARVTQRFAVLDDADQARESHLHVFDDDDGNGERGDRRWLRSTHVPLRGDRDHPPAVLMVIDDVTPLMRERRRREDMLHHLVDTLVSAVEDRDAGAAGHAHRVTEVAGALAVAMDLPEEERDTIDLASRLMTVGKLWQGHGGAMAANQPPETDLAAPAPRDATLRLLEPVPFDRPVVATLREMTERWDGRGPMGLKGDAIRRPARVLAVAAAFVAMVVPPAGNKPAGFEDAICDLQARAARQFDRRVVSALANHLDNQGGAERWSRAWAKARFDQAEPI